MTSSPHPKPRKHLMTPGQPRPITRTTDITTVQRWVLSSLAFVTIEHMAGGLVVAAALTDEERIGTRIGLLLVATGFGVIGAAAAVLIHHKRLPSPWLLLGLIPSTIGVYFCFLA